MQRRIEQAHDYRQTVHSPEHAEEVASLSLEDRRRPFANRFVIVEDEGLDDLLAFAQEHVLGTAQADTLRAEIA